MVFITVGSQKFQFDRLLKAVDLAIEHGVIDEEVYAQIGVSGYTPARYAFCRFLNKDEFSAKLKDASLIITHGGTGVITTALKNHQRVLAMPRLKKYGEHVDDHQTQLLKAFEKANYICVCNDGDDFEQKVTEAMTMTTAPFRSNTDAFIGKIREYIETI